MCGPESKISAAATGASWLPNRDESLMLGRARARASRAIAPARSNNNNKCRKRSRRWLVSCRFWMNRRAGNSSNFGRWRMIKCRMIGITISPAPDSNATFAKLRNVIGRDGSESGLRAPQSGKVVQKRC